MSNYPFAPSRSSLIKVFVIVIGVSGFLGGGLELGVARTRELIKNGDFETGDLSRWKAFSSNPVNANFFRDDPGSTTPINLEDTAPNPRGGTSYAVSDSNDPSYMILRQKFRVPRKVKRLILRYQLFVFTRHPVVKNPAGFNLTSGTNQQARVDFLKGGAGQTNIAGGVIKRLYTRGADVLAPVTPPPWKNYRFNLTRKVKPGRKYQIRLGVIARQNVLVMGVDNVSAKAR